MAELEGLQFEVIADGSDTASHNLDSLATSLSNIKSALRGGSFKGLTNSLKNLNDALTGITNNNIKKITSLGQSADSLAKLSGVRISPTIAKQITNIGQAVDSLPEGSASKIDDICDSLSKLKGVSISGLGDDLKDTNKALKDTVKNNADTTNVEKIPGTTEPDVKPTPSLEPEPKDDTSATLKMMSVKAQIATSVLKGFQQTAMKARGALIDLGKGAFDAGKEIGDRLTSGFRNAKNAFNSFANSIGRIALYRAIRSAIKQVTEGLQEGIDNMYQWSNTADGVFASSMDKLATSSNYLKNSFAAMVAPLINAVAPAIDYVIDKVVSLFNIINQVFAAITGASTWTKAIKFPTKYADSLGGATKATKGATKAAKDYQTQLLGIDELNVLDPDKNKDKSGGGGGGAGGGGADAAAMSFQNEPISSKVKDWLKTDDWTGLGEEVAEKLNGVLAKVDNWFKDTLEPNLMSWSNRIATFVNGFADKFDWGLLGDTIADGLNAVIRPLNNLLSSIDWETIGKGFATSVDHIFDRLDWSAVGQLIGNGLNVVIRTFNGFITEFSKHAYQYGLDLATAVNSIFATIKWKEVGQNIVLGVNSLRDIINGLNDGIKWDDIKKDIDTGLNYAIANVDTAGLGKAASDLVVHVLDVFKSIDWYGVGLKIGQFISNIDWSTIISDVVDMVARLGAGYIKGSFSPGGILFNSIVFGIPLLGGAIDLGSKAFSTTLQMKMAGMETPLADAFMKVFKSSAMTGAKEGIPAGGKMGVALGIGALAIGLPMYFLNLLDACKNGLNLLNGALIPAGSTIAGAGAGAIIGSLGGPIGAGIGALIGLAVGGITDLVLALSQHKDEIKKWFSDRWDDIKNFFTSAVPNWWNGTAAPFLKALPGKLGYYAGQAVGSIVKWFIDLPKNISDAVSSAVDRIKEWASKVVDTAVKGIKKLPDRLRELGGDIINGLLNGLKDGWKDFKKGIKDFVDGFVKGFKDALGIHSPSTVFAEIGGNCVDGLDKGVNDKGKDSQGVFSKFASDVKSWFKGTGAEDIVTKFTSFGSDIVGGFKDKVGSAYTDAKANVTTWASKVKEWFTSDGEGSVNSNKFATFAYDTITGFKNKIGSSFTDTKNNVITWASNVRDWFTNDSNGGVNSNKFSTFAYDTITGFKNRIGTSFTDTKNNILTWASDVKDWFTNDSNGGVNANSFSNFAANTISGFKTKIGNSFTDTKNGIVNWAGSVKNWFSDNANGTHFANFASGTINGFKDRINGRYTDTKSPMQNFANNVNAWFSGITNGTPFAGLASDVINGFKDRINGRYTDAKDPMTGFANNVNGWFSGIVNGTPFAGFASNVIDGFKDRINGTYGNAQKPMNDFANHVVSWFSNPGTKLTDSFTSIGSNVIQGFINGVNSLWETACDKIEQFGKDIIGAGKKGTKEKSPSRAFKQIGAYVIEGFNIGVQDMIPQSFKTMDTWLDGINSYHPNVGFDVSANIADLNLADTEKAVSAYVNRQTDVTVSGHVEETNKYYDDVIMPILNKIAGDVERQADKKEETIVQIGNRTINDAVTTQRSANGFRFTEN